MVSVRTNNVKSLVIGNGESRKGVDLSSLKNDYTLIGCNAIHRDIVVDHLVCCDRRMGEEATNNEQSKDTLIYVRDDWFHYFRKIKKNKNIRVMPALPYTGELKQDRPEHWGSGCYAVLVAAELGSKEVTLLGFDLYGVNNRVNNVYKDTKNYSAKDSQAVDPSYWIYQIAKVFTHFPETKFIIKNKSDWQLPKEWKKLNVEFVAL